MSLTFADLTSLGYDPIPLIDNDKRPRDTGWPTLKYDPVREADCHQIGIRLGLVRALDIDVTNVKLSAALEREARNFIGQLTPTRTGKPPKRLLLFRVEGPGPKIKITLTKGVVACAIEILGRGQQCVIEGIHPETHKPYKLNRPLPKSSELITLTFDQLSEMLVSLGGVAQKHGWSVNAPPPKHDTNVRSPPPYSIVGPPTQAAIDDVYRNLPKLINSDLHYDDWFAVLCGVKSKLGDVGHDIAFDWSLTSSKHDDHTFARVWRKITRDGGTYFGTVMSMIEQQSTRNDVHVQKPNEIVDETQGRLPPTFMRWGELSKEIILPEPFISDWLPRHVTAMCSAHGGSGKSYIALEVGIRLAMGLPVFGMKRSPVSALMFSCEDDEEVARWRAKLICNKLKVEYRELESSGRFGYIDATTMGDTSLFSRTRGITDLLDELYYRAHDMSAQILIIDGASNTFDAEENARAQVGAFISSLNRVARELDGSNLLLAHVNKMTAKGEVTSENYSGSTAWHNAVRVRWSMTPDKDDREVQYLELQKTNYGKPGQQFRVQWDADSHTFEWKESSNARSADIHSPEIAATMRKMAADGIRMPVSILNNNNLLNLLRVRMPDKLDRINAKVLDMTLLRLESQGVIHREEDRISGRKSERWMPGKAPK